MRNSPFIFLQGLGIALYVVVVSLKGIGSNLTWSDHGLAVRDIDGVKGWALIAVLGLSFAGAVVWMSNNVKKRYPIATWSEWGDCQRRIFENAKREDKGNAKDS